MSDTRRIDERMRMDARQERTRAALRAAAIELATEGPITAITATELAARAGVHRSTLYQWASSPAEIVLDALRAELDEIRARHLGGSPGSVGDPRAATEAVTRDVLLHLEKHAELYRREFDRGDSGVYRMLAQHFAASADVLLTGYGIAAPVVPGIDPAISARAAERYVAGGAAGAMASWLDSPAPRDPDVFLALFVHLLPPWWPSASVD